MPTDFIAEAKRIAEQLRLLDFSRVVFGANKHHYRFAPVLAMADVESSEQASGITLPVAYRRFVTELGNGGAGPFYGIEPFPTEIAHLRLPFPFTEEITLNDESPENDKDWEAVDHGTIIVAEYGCGMYVLLVVNGPATGQVWFDARYEGGVQPLQTRDGTRLTFDSWWLIEMGQHLLRFEAIHTLMQQGLPHETIHQQCDPRWGQLDVDQAMLSLMRRDPNARPRTHVDKPWGAACGLVEDHYGLWLRDRP